MARVPQKGTGKSTKQMPKEDLEVAAYYRWLNRGCPQGDSLTDWVEAQEDLEKSPGPASVKK